MLHFYSTIYYIWKCIIYDNLPVSFPVLGSLIILCGFALGLSLTYGYNSMWLNVGLTHCEHLHIFNRWISQSQIGCDLLTCHLTVCSFATVFCSFSLLSLVGWIKLYLFCFLLLSQGLRRKERKGTLFQHPVKLGWRPGARPLTGTGISIWAMRVSWG